MRTSTFASLFFANLFALSTLHSQSLSWRIHAGGNYSEFRGSGLGFLYNKGKVGFLAGAAFTLDFTSRVGLQTGLNYERKRGKDGLILTDENGEPIDNGKVVGNFDYLTMPLLVVLYPGKQHRFFLHAGPSLGYLAKQELVFNVDGFDDANWTKSNRRVDVLAVGGVGGVLPLADQVGLILEARSSWGLLNLNDGLPGKLKSFSVSGLLGVEFRLN